MPNIFDQFDEPAVTALPPLPVRKQAAARNVFDQFDAPTAVVLPGQGAQASVASEEARPSSPIADMYRADQEYQSAARQSTNWEVRDPKGNFKRPVLGEGFELDDGNVWFKDQQGQPVRADKAKHVVMRDPQTNKMMVFARTPETDQNKLLSVGQVIVPGLATGPVTGVSRAVQVGQAPTRAASTAQHAAEVAEDAAAFDRLGVRKFGPAFQTGVAGGTAKQLTEMPLVGAPVRNALEGSLTSARDASQRVAGKYGSATTARDAGLTAQEGIERFKDARPTDVVEDAIRNLPDERLNEIIGAPASATSLKTKLGALYERAWRFVPERMRAGRAVEGDPRVMGNPANTRGVLEEIVGRNVRMTNQAQAAREGSDAFANPVRGGLLGRMIETLRTPQWTANLQTLRDMRSEFRRLASGMTDTERNTLKLSDLDRVQSAITKDMIVLMQRNAAAYRMRANPTAEAVASFEATYGKGASNVYLEGAQKATAADRAKDLHTALGFERSIREFARADKFTRLSMERLDAIERLFKADSAESLARNITSAALAGGKGNEQLLRTLRRTLRPEEMSEIAAALIHELGRPVGSARGITEKLGFSVNSFLTKWQNMSPAAKELLFSGEHRKSLDDLVRVVDRLANVEALANSSRSFTNTLGISTIATAGATMMAGLDAMLTAGAGAAGLGAASVLFSRPSYVRWVIGYAKAKAAARDVHNMGKLVAQIASEVGIIEGGDGNNNEGEDMRGVQPDENPERQLRGSHRSESSTGRSRLPPPMHLGGPKPTETSPAAPSQRPQRPPSMAQLLEGGYTRLASTPTSVRGPTMSEMLQNNPRGSGTAPRPFGMSAMLLRGTGPGESADPVVGRRGRDPGEYARSGGAGQYEQRAAEGVGLGSVLQGAREAGRLTAEGIRDADPVTAAGGLALATFVTLPGLRARSQKPKPAEWGGEWKLSSEARAMEARAARATGEYEDVPASAYEKIWEKTGWARQGRPGDEHYNAVAAQQGVKPGEWYTEAGYREEHLGDRYALGIGERRTMAPWKALDDHEPERAFDAPTDVVDAPINDPRNQFAASAKQQQARDASAGASAPARKLAEKVRNAEDVMRAQKLSDAQIANRLNNEFGLDVTSHQVRTGRVWWRVSGGEAGKPGEHVRPQWGDEVVSRLRDDDVASLHNREAAALLEKEFAHPYTERALRDKRARLGLPSPKVPLSEYRQPARKMRQSNYWPEKMEERLHSPELVAMTNAEAAKTLNSEFRQNLTAEALREKRVRLGILDKSPKGHAVGDPSKMIARQKLDDIIEAAIEKHFVEKGLSYAKTAKAVSEETGKEVSKKTVENWLLRRGIKRSPKAGD